MCTAAPNIMANFGTNGDTDCYGTINFDSGAMVSYIHESMITYSDYIEAGPRTQEFYGAGGDRLKLKPFVINIKVNVNDKGVYEFRNVLVATSNTPSRTMLVGQSDMERLGIDISFTKRVVTFNRGALKGVPLPMERNIICTINPVKLTRREENPESIQQLHAFESEDKLSTVGNVGADECKVEDCCVNLSKRQKDGEPFVRPTRDPNLTGDPKGALLREIERMRQRSQETFTGDDVIKDGRRATEHPITPAGIRRLCGKYKSIFARNTGRLPYEFTITNTITVKMSKMEAVDLFFKGTSHNAVIKQFRRRAANGATVHSREIQRGLEDGRVNHLKNEAQLQTMVKKEQAQLSRDVTTTQKQVHGQLVRFRRKSERRYQQKGLPKNQRTELMPCEDPELNVPLVNNHFPTEVKTRDTVQPQIRADNSNILVSPSVQNVDFSTKQLVLKKNAGFDTERGECRWNSFDLVEKNVRKRLEKSKLSEFIDRKVLLANTLQSAQKVPLNIEMIPELQPPVVVKPLTRWIESREVPNALEIRSEEEVFSLPFGEGTPLAEDQKILDRGPKRTRSEDKVFSTPFGEEMPLAEDQRTLDRGSKRTRSEDEALPLPIGEETPLAEDRKTLDCGPKRTKPGRKSRIPIRHENQAANDEVRQNLNFERIAVGLTPIRIKKMPVNKKAT